jgi:hypothetical protein
MKARLGWAVQLAYRMRRLRSSRNTSTQRVRSSTVSTVKKLQARMVRRGRQDTEPKSDHRGEVPEERDGGAGCRGWWSPRPDIRP